MGQTKSRKCLSLKCTVRFTIRLKLGQDFYPTPEDLIIMKAIAHRPKDLLDIQGIIQSHPDLDGERIQEWVTQFAEFLEMPELWEDIAEWLCGGL